jgi:hypothetical protein
VLPPLQMLLMVNIDAVKIPNQIEVQKVLKYQNTKIGDFLSPKY